MALQRFTTGINREDLTQECLRELRLWPGCETVEGVAVCGKFAVRVVSYGPANKKNADRALRRIQREKARRFHLKVE
jgi:methyl coenzyme M reductase subunit D